MTPAEHLDEAERLLTAVRYPPMSGDPVQVATFTAIAQAHILAAIAVELGAPHPTATTGGDHAAAAPPGP